ncbi:Hypothetical protein R9X50_00574800 [Acrodontium crateriforme]|uniref:PHD-type domain-containing protein n=1 Tax=Acrodontium crateriforme TaxID=150365 RepID=A0AAQ3RBR5_9PEZI|nr:Hypothetical protein R9X50_00574800 [Acrodontium crateriforme]
MEEIQPIAPDAPEGASHPSSIPPPSFAPPSTSDLSEVPMTDDADVTTTPPEAPKEIDSSFQEPRYSMETEEIVKRANANAASGSHGWEAAKEQLMKDMATSDKFATSSDPSETKTPNRGGRGGKNSKFAEESLSKLEASATASTPGSTGRGRGRPGRPRGSRSRGGGPGRGRGGKRKRDDRDDDDDDDSDSSEVYTPAATQTKSGRAVQKPTSFVPPPPVSPPTHKRKRTYRRNPESAVCKMCLRGTSPATNMIVFCDGCNTPYHRYCHHPPIDQAVVEELEKEWYCRNCERERVVPVANTEVESFVGVVGVSEDERRNYFSRLAPGVLATLLVRATNIQPDLPVFAPEFASNFANGAQVDATPTTDPQTAPKASTVQTTRPTASTSTTRQASENPPMDNTGPSEYNIIPDEHPTRYPDPGQGMMKTLPPDHTESHSLVDEVDRHGVFSHVYLTDPVAAKNGVDASTGADEK